MCLVKYTIHNEYGYPVDYHFRPDGKFRAYGKAFWFEADMGTERKDALSSKFEGYARYLNTLIKEPNNLPAETIFFISNPKSHHYGFRRRWVNLIESFYSVLGDWTKFIDLRAAPVTEVPRLLEIEKQRAKYKGEFYKIIETYMNAPEYNGSPLYEHRIRDDQMAFSITANTLFLYLNIEGFETKAISNLLEFEKQFNSSRKNIDEFKSINKIVPVFYSFNLKSYIPIKSTIAEGVLEKLLQHHWKVDLTEDLPKWFNFKNDPIHSINPIALLDE